MTPEREAQMREMFHAWLQSKGFKAEAASRRPNGTYINGQLQDRWNTWLACARALDPMVRDGERMRWLLDGNGFFMEEQGLCGYAPCSDEEKNAARDEIDAAMSAALERKNATD